MTAPGVPVPGTRAPVSRARLVTTGVVTAALLTAVTATAAVTRPSVSQARASAAATRLAVETLTTVETLGCDHLLSAADTAKCARALPAPAPRAATGHLTTSGVRDGHRYHVRVATTSQLACSSGAKIVTGKDAVVRRTAVATVAGQRFTTHIDSPVEALALVPAETGMPVQLTTRDGVTTSVAAGPSGCAAFPVRSGATIVLPDGTELTATTEQGTS